MLVAFRVFKAADAGFLCAFLFKAKDENAGAG